MTVLQDNINVNDLKTIVSLPPNKSGPAVIQWSWASEEDGGFYMACSDIMISAKGRSASRRPPPPANVPAGSCIWWWREYRPLY